MERRHNQVDLRTLLDTPPWDWPRDAGTIFQQILTDNKANESDRRIAAQLAGDFTVINNELCDALLGIVSSADQSEQLRAAAAISLGPVLEQADLEQADTDEFENPDDVPISAPTFHRIRRVLHKLYSDERVPKAVRRRILEASVRSPQVYRHSRRGKNVCGRVCGAGHTRLRMRESAGVSLRVTAQHGFRVQGARGGRQAGRFARSRSLAVYCPRMSIRFEKIWVQQCKATKIGNLFSALLAHDDSSLGCPPNAR
jgi:uncharacterized protein (UPF0147 family)